MSITDLTWQAGRGLSGHGTARQGMAEKRSTGPHPLEERKATMSPDDTACDNATLGTPADLGPGVEREWGVHTGWGETDLLLTEEEARQHVGVCDYDPPCVLVSRTSPDAAWESTS